MTFANATQAATTATFSETGVYVLRLRASDSQLDSSDDITITSRKPHRAPCPWSCSTQLQAHAASAAVSRRSPAPTHWTWHDHQELMTIGQ